MAFKRNFAAVLALAGNLVFSPVQANQRHFGYSYESAGLPRGEREFEFSTTWRSGRNVFYSRFENRLEYETGLSERLLTALYINWNKVTESGVNESEFSGISSEWKYSFTNAASQGLGLAGYAELTLDTDEVELELKAILDKSFGSCRAAYNAVAEFVTVPEAGKLRRHELEMQHTAGLYFEVSPSFGLGLEGRTFTLFEGGESEFTALFAGPTIHYSKAAFWATLALQSQVSASAEDATRLSGGLELTELERTNVRLLVSLPL